jgi:hypothetical protein
MSTWTAEAIRALGVRTDLPTLGEIFGISRARAYQMAHTGEWERAGIRIVPLGSKYAVAVQSILDVLGYGHPGPVPEPANRSPLDPQLSAVSGADHNAIPQKEEQK